MKELLAGLAIGSNHPNARLTPPRVHLQASAQSPFTMKRPLISHHVSFALKHLALAAAAVALAGSARAQLPVTNGLQCWFDAAQGVTTSGSNVTGWADQSGNGYHATLGAGTPLLATNQVNGRPAIKFQGGNNYLKINYNLIPRQEYIVFRSGNYARDAVNTNQWGGDWGGPFGQQGVNNHWMFESGTKRMWGSYVPLAVSQNGTALVQNNANGNPYGMADVYSYMVLKVNPINYPSAYGLIGRPNTSWGNGYQDVAEIIAFNRVLSTAEENQIGGYLATKYAITSTYTPMPLMMRLDSPFSSQAYLSGSSVSTSATVISPLGTGPYTVKFFTNTGGSMVQVGSTQSGAGPTFTQSLGTPANGSYQVYARVTDSAGSPVTVDSTTSPFSVAPPVATTTTISATTASTYGQSVTLTATVAPTPAGGTVQFYDNGSTLGGPIALTTGAASYVTTTLAAGTHPITAVFSSYGISVASSASAKSQVVNKATLLVTADNKVRSPGDANPVLTYQISGYQNGETLVTAAVTGTPVLACAADLLSPAGTYPITTASGSLAAANYSFSGVAGSLKVVAGAPPSVANANMACWYDAAQGVTASGGNVTKWNDQSGNGHDATTASGTTTLVASDTQITKPAVHLRGASTWLNCAGGMFTKEQYLVVRSPNAAWSGSGSFLGRTGTGNSGARSSSYNMYSGYTGFWDDQLATAVSKNGTIISSAKGSMPRGGFELGTITDYMILKITVNNGANAANLVAYPFYQIGRNDNLGTMDFDVAEILGYDAALSSADETAVGAYLSFKYGMNTAYAAAGIRMLVTGFPFVQAAGTAGSITVTLKDPGGNTVTGYTGTVHFTSSATAAVLPADYTFVAADNGTHTFTNAVTLKSAGLQTITAADSVNGTLTGTQSGITVTPLGASTLTVAGFPNPGAAGVAGSVTLTAKDIFGNTASGYTGTVHFTSSDGTAVLPANYTFISADNGTHAFAGVTLYTPGTQSITATDTITGSVTGTQSGITMASGALVMPVTSGLVCWYDASRGVTTSGANVTAWADQSGQGNNAVTGSGTPVLVASDTQISKPSVHIRGGGSWLDCAGLFFTKEQYLVVRSPNATWNGSGCFLGRNAARDSSYNLANGTTGFWQDWYPTNVSKNGVASSYPLPAAVLNWGSHDNNGNFSNGCNFAINSITNFMILKITVQGNASNDAYRIGRNNNLGSCDMDIAEILGFDSALSAADEAMVGAYLAKKYSLASSYPTATFTSTALALTGGTTPCAVGASLTFMATVAGLAPTGSVTFYDGATSLGTGTLNGISQATLTTSSLAAGTHSITARYAGDTGNAISVSGALSVQVATAADILTFTFPGLPATTITGTNISVTVPYATAVTALAPTYTTLPGATGNPVSGTARNFTGPLTYVINGTKTYTVTVAKIAASTAKDILACDFGALGAAVITGTNIALTVPPSQSRSLAPTFSLSPLATLSPLSGSTQDFTNPITYTVTAENGSTKAYVVTVQTYESWGHHGSFFILTTPDGVNLAASASESNFPLLVRLSSSNFNFAEAQSDGRDIRFSTPAGAPLFYELEKWDAANSQAAVWVKIPAITGNARQEIQMHWGNPGVTSESNGSGVFNAANGYASVLHMSETVSDAAGTVSASDTGTTLATGMIGKGRNFTAGKGILCGTSVSAYPTGANPHSTEAWIRPVAGSTNVLGWGVEKGSGRVVMQVTNPQFIDPPHMNIDCYSGGGNVTSASFTPLSQWMHVAHTYKSGEAKIYVNGVLDGTNTSGTMDIPTPAAVYLGGWNGSYNYNGDMDEVRVSRVTRSAEWIKMEYENQKPLQTLVGGLVQSGSTFSVSPASVTMDESTTTPLTAQAGGAQKVYWIERKGGVDTLLATDQLTLNVSSARVTGNQSYVIRFKGIYPTETKLIDVPITVTDTLPDPLFTLAGPAIWDGRQTITLTPNISNLAALQAAGVASFNYTWSVAGVAVAKQITPGLLTLTHAQGSGPLSVSLTMDNGGSPVTVTKTIAVQEPASDAWVQRTPGATEKPVNGQFFARDPNTGKGTIYYNGTQSGSPTSVFLKVYTTDTGSDVLYSTLRQALVAGAYAFTSPIDAGKVTYKVVYGTTTGGVDTIVATVSDLVCGDVYIIQGQSNALALDNSAPSDLTTNKWIRTYGSSGGSWGYAVSKGSEMYLGLWGYDLATTLVATHNMPVCFINGAVGGTLIYQHQANPAGHGTPGASYSIYANLYNRVVGANLTHGIRGVFWHQGESDSATGAPTGDWNYKSYQQYFVDMSSAWKQDFPNIQRYIIYQVQPKPCAMGPYGDQLRDRQRTLPLLFSNMSVLSTIGIDTTDGYEGCHYNATGYQAFSDLTAPLVGRDFYGETPAASVTAPILRRAYYTTGSKNEIALEFDQNISWNPLSTVNFYLDRVAGKVTGGSATGKLVKLTLSATSTSQTIDYVEDNYWNGSAGNLLTGSNAISVLTFSGVVIGPPAPISLSATPGSGQVALTWTAPTGATGYSVKRSGTSGGPYTLIGTATGTTFTDTAVTNGATYYYVTSAVTNVSSSAGEGADSNQASATPLDGFALWIDGLNWSGFVNPDKSLTGDPDHDGLTNFEEYAFGLDPTKGASANPIKVQLDKTSASFTYTRRATPASTGLVYTVWTSPDLATWSNTAYLATEGTLTTANGVETVPVTLSGGPPSAPKLFVRVAAE